MRAEIQKIFRAMKRYGLIVADNGSDMYISGTWDDRWDNDVLNPGLRRADGERLRGRAARLAAAARAGARGRRARRAARRTRTAILEPGETVVVEPSWENPRSRRRVALSGTASGFGGPAGATYTIADAAAGYGTPAAGSSRRAASRAIGELLRDDRLRPRRAARGPLGHGLHGDRQRDGGEDLDAARRQAAFPTCPSSDPFYGKIETLFHNGVTAGCTGGNYCPDASVTRAQMAVFL